MAAKSGVVKGLLITFLIVESLTLPIFRSGGRTGLTYWEWIYNHTIWGPPVEYVPEEDYVRELTPNPDNNWSFNAARKI